MSANVLTEAADLMEQRANAVGPAPWLVGDGNEGTVYNPLWIVTNDVFHNPPADAEAQWVAFELHTGTKVDAEHVASWSPPVALAVAAWLRDARCQMNCFGGMRDPYCWRCGDSGNDHDCPPRVACGHSSEYRHALKVALAYLGRDA